MAKAVQIAGAIVGVAAIIASGGLGAPLAAGLTGALGVSSTVITGAALGLNVAGAALQKGPKAPSTVVERLTASVDPLAFRKQVFGETAFPIDVRYEEWFGPNQDFGGWVIALAGHAIESVDEIWINSELAWSAAGGVQAKFVGYFWVKHIVLEGTPSNTITITEGATSTWNTSHRLTGCAYAHLQFRVTAIGKKDTSPFNGGIPSRITIKGKGAKVYDPRRDSTVPGGSGPMRADDQSTWRYFADDDHAPIGANLPLQILRELLGWRVRNPQSGDWALAVGSGLKPRKIDLASFIVAANIADEQANRSAGGTESKYHGGCALSEGDTPATRLDTLCAASNARIVDAHGKIGIRIAHNDLASAATDPGLGDDDVMGPVTWEPDPAFSETPNVARGKFVDPSNGSLFQLVDYPEVRVGAPTGRDRVLAMDLGAAQSGSHAQRVVKQALQRKQYQRTFSAPFDITAWRYNVGDVVPLTYSPLGFVRKLFRVVAMDPRSNPVPVVLREESAAIYQWDADDAPPVQPAAPTVYDTRNSPYLLGIDRLDDAVDGANGRIDVAAGQIDALGGQLVEIDDRLVDVQATLAQAEADLAAIDASLGEVTGSLLDLRQNDAAAEAARQQLSNAQSRQGAALLQAALLAAQDGQRLTDAGLYVDPGTGQVKLYAVEQQAGQLARVSIELAAAQAKLALTATRDFVNEAIVQALLDPSQVGEFGEIIARLNAAELSIDALLAEVQLKASADTVGALGSQVVEISQSLSAAQAALETKVEATTFNQLSALVTTIQQQLLGLGDTIGLVTTIRQARFETSQTAAASLGGAIAAEMANQARLAELAQVQQQLTTQIVSGLSAEATSRLTLQAQINDRLASIVSQLSSLVTTSAAQAQQLLALGASVAGVNEELTARVTELNQAISNLTSSTATATAAVNARVDGVQDDLSGEVASLEQVIAALDSVRAQNYQAANARIDGVAEGLTASAASLQQAITDGDGALALALEAVEASAADTEASVTLLREALVDPSGAAVSKLVLGVNADGRIGSAVATATGELTTLDFAFDEVSFFLPDGTLAMEVAADADGPLVNAPRMRVGLLQTDTAVIARRFASEITMQGQGINNLRMQAALIQFDMPIAGWVDAIFNAQQGFASGNQDWSLVIEINGQGRTVNAGRTNDTPTITYSRFCDAGPIEVAVYWRAHNSVTLGDRLLLANAFPATANTSS